MKYILNYSTVISLALYYLAAVFSVFPVVAFQFQKGDLHVIIIFERNNIRNVQADIVRGKTVDYLI